MRFSGWGVALSRVLVATGAILAALNIYGLFLPLRPSVLASPWPGRPIAPGPEYAAIESQIDALSDLDTRAYAREVNEIVHRGIAHIRPEHLQAAGYTEEDEVERLHLRVPVWENYILFALSYVKPDTYRRYEFCSHEKALNRGVGDCGQQSLAVVSLLSRRGIESGFVDWSDQHVAAVAMVAANEWYVLDPDYHVIIPYRIDADGGPPPSRLSRLAEAYRASHPDTQAVVSPDGLVSMAPEKLYKSERQTVTFGGPAARWARACRIEQAAYALKWTLPAFLPAPWLVFAGIRAARKRRQTLRGARDAGG